MKKEITIIKDTPIIIKNTFDYVANRIIKVKIIDVIIIV